MIMNDKRVEPQVYGLQTTVEILITIKDNDGLVVIPDQATLIVSDPLGHRMTAHKADMATGATYLSYEYYPTVSGWYTYEASCMDSTGRSVTKSNGFTVTDRL